MNKIKITKDIIYSNDIPTEISIIHISDVHFNINTKSNLFIKIANTINDIKPDYVIITGDLVDDSNIIHNNIKIKELVFFLKTIAKTTKIIIGLGNHDLIMNNDYKFFDKLNEIPNIYVLNNKNYHDEFINITGFTLPTNYYYNIYNEESLKILSEYLDKQYHLIKENSLKTFNIALIHSPIRLNEPEIIKRLANYDLLLSGHTHDGMIPDFIKFLFPKNMGLISPHKKIFPKFCRGKIIQNTNSKNQTLIISGGVTKLSLKSARALSKLNFVYNISINNIIIKKKRG